MTEQPGGHARFEELAAGYALNALDPADEREFAAHLSACAHCQQALAGYMLVAADMAEAWQVRESARPPARLGESIMDEIARDATAAPPSAITARAPTGGSSSSGQPTRASRAWQSRRRRLAAFGAGLAAVIALIAGGVIAGRLAGEHNARPPAACSHSTSCHQVALTAPGSVTTTARVIVRDRAVWLVPTGLRPDNRARQTYVLWQITANRTAVAVGTFDVRAHARQPVLVGSLVVGYHQTKEFAVSLERGRKAPPSPSRPVATGLASS